MEGKSGAEQRLIFRAPGRLLSSVPDGVTGQKGHFAKFFPEWVSGLGINKREDFFNVADVFRGNEVTWSNFKTNLDHRGIQYPKKKKKNRNKVSIFLSLYTIVRFLGVIFKWHCQLNKVYSIVLFVVKDHIRLELRINDSSTGRVPSVVVYPPMSLNRERSSLKFLSYYRWGDSQSRTGQGSWELRVEDHKWLISR